MNRQLFEEDVKLYLNKISVSFEHISLTNQSIIKTDSCTFLLVGELYVHHKSQEINSAFIIYQDLWVRRNIQLKSRLHSLLKLNNKVHARLCQVKAIDKPTAELFLQENHMLGYLKSASKFGLFCDNELIAVATFSAGRKMRRLEENERSYELIAFASKNFHTIVGGLDKLLKHFIRVKNPADIMTYVDIEQGSIHAYEKLGFKLIAVTEPNIFYLHDGIRIKNNIDDTVIEFQNKGNYKLLLSIK